MNKEEIEKAKEDLSFMHEGDYITKEMEHSAIVLEEYIKELENKAIILDKVTDKLKENKEIEEFKTEYTMRQMDRQFKDKINEIIQVVNKLIKESEEK